MADVTVDVVQNNSKDLMKSQYDVVTSFIDILRDFTAIDKVDYPQPDNPLELIDQAWIEGLFDRLLALKPNNLPGNEPYPPEPIAPNLGDIAPVSPESVPDFTGVAPAITSPAVPSPALPGLPTPPTVVPPIIPPAPPISLPPVPAFSPVQIPSSLGLNLPDFQYSVPVSDLTAPTEHFTFNEQDYSSVLSDAIKLKLLTDIENGGYGIDTNDERGLWDRARERTAVEANAKVAEAMRLAAARGFSLPPGADLAVIADAQQAALEKIASVDREIALKRADMYVENRKFAIQAAKDVESMFINYRSALMERSLNAAKSLVELGVAVFNAKKDKYLADLEAYKTYASVYEAKIRGELTKIELFKGQVEAARGAIDIQRAMVDVYKAQIEGIGQTIQLFQAQIEGTKALMEAEQLKIATFRAQMDGYSSQVQAKTAEFGLYEAQVRANATLVQRYQAEIEAHKSRVSASQARIESHTARVNSEKARNEGLIDKYRSEVTRYQTTLERWFRWRMTELERYKSDIGLFGVQADSFNKASDFALRANMENNMRNNKFIDRQIASVERDTANLFKLMDWRTNNAKIGTDATTQLAIAAAQQITGLTSLLKEA